MNDFVEQIRKSIEEETGSPCSRDVADVQVDRMCDAFVQKWDGVGPAYAVADAPDVARYLSHRWDGEEGRRLHETIAAFESGAIARLAMAEGWASEPEPTPRCTWLVEVPTASLAPPDMLPDGTCRGCGADTGGKMPYALDCPIDGEAGCFPDSPSDVNTIVECGAAIGPHPSYPNVPDATLCENGHDHLPIEIELAPFGPAWQREARDRYDETGRFL